MQGGIGFIVLGGFFVVSLLKAVWAIINKDWDKEPFNAKSFLGVFKTTILALVLLIIFMFYILPHLDQ